MSTVYMNQNVKSNRPPINIQQQQQPPSAQQQAHLSQAQIQKTLDDNNQLIQNLADCQNKGKLQDIFYYSSMLYKNLEFMLHVTDNTANIQSLLPLPTNFTGSQPGIAAHGNQAQQQNVVSNGIHHPNSHHHLQNNQQPPQQQTPNQQQQQQQQNSMPPPPIPLNHNNQSQQPIHNGPPIGMTSPQQNSTNANAHLQQSQAQHSQQLNPQQMPNQAQMMHNPNAPQNQFASPVSKQQQQQQQQQQQPNVSTPQQSNQTQTTANQPQNSSPSTTPNQQPNNPIESSNRNNATPPNNNLQPGISPHSSQQQNVPPIASQSQAQFRAPNTPNNSHQYCKLIFFRTCCFDTLN